MLGCLITPSISVCNGDSTSSPLANFGLWQLQLTSVRKGISSSASTSSNQLQQVALGPLFCPLFVAVGQSARFVFSRLHFLVWSFQLQQLIGKFCALKLCRVDANSKCRLLPIPVEGAISSIYMTIACPSVHKVAGATSSIYFKNCLECRWHK